MALTLQVIFKNMVVGLQQQKKTFHIGMLSDIKITNGVIIQWGSIFSSQFAKDYVNGTFTFPVAMVPVCVISTACNEGDIITVRDWTTAGFNYSIHDRLPQYEAYISFSWLAVGF